jgi:hypothetical protein
MLSFIKFRCVLGVFSVVHSTTREQVLTLYKRAIDMSVMYQHFPRLGFLSRHAREKIDMLHNRVQEEEEENRNANTTASLE